LPSKIYQSQTWRGEHHYDYLARIGSVAGVLPVAGLENRSVKAKGITNFSNCGLGGVVLTTPEQQHINLFKIEM